MQFVSKDTFIEKLQTELNDVTIGSLATREKESLFVFAKAVIDSCPKINSLEIFESIYNLNKCFKDNIKVLFMLKCGADILMHCYLVVEDANEQLYYKEKCKFVYQQFQEYVNKKKAL